MNLPLIIDSGSISVVEQLVMDNVEMSRNEWDSFESSCFFSNHPFIDFKQKNTEVTSIRQSFDYWRMISEDRFSKLKNNEEELNTSSR